MEDRKQWRIERRNKKEEWIMKNVEYRVESRTERVESRE